MTKRLKKTLVKYSPTDFFDGCRQRGRAKRDQGSLQAHENVGGLSIDTFFCRKALEKNTYLQKLMIIFQSFSKKIKKKNPIDFTFIIPILEQQEF